MEAKMSGIRLEELCSRVSPWLEGDSMTAFLKRQSETAEGYQEVWRRLVNHLKSTRERLRASLEPDQKRELDSIIGYLEKTILDARNKMMKLDVVIRYPLDRAFQLAAAIDRGDSPETIDDGAVQHFLQGLYDESPSAQEVMERVARVLMKGDQRRYPQIPFLASQVKCIPPGVRSKRLKKRGVVLREKLEVCAPHQFRPGERDGAVAARRVRLEELARISPMKREEQRIILAEKRGFPYAGRRQDIQDSSGHHPFFKSIHDANQARKLTAQGKKWQYCPHAFCIEVPESETKVSQRTLYFEPEFYLPTEQVYLALISERRGIQPGSTQERARWIAAIRDLMPSIKIEVIFVRGLKKEIRGYPGMETLRTTIRRNKKTVDGPGDNIATNPDNFLMPVDQCPCGTCVINRKTAREQTTGRMQWRPTRASPSERVIEKKRSYGR